MNENTLNNPADVTRPTPPPPPLDDSADLYSGYEPGFPLIDPQVCEMKITDTEKLTNAAGTIQLKLSNVEVVRSIKGEVINPGEATVFATTNTVVTGKSNPKMIKDGIAFILQACEPVGITSVSGFAANHSLLKGQVARVKLDTAPAGTNPKTGKHYEARTEITKWYKRGSSME